MCDMRDVQVHDWRAIGKRSEGEVSKKVCENILQNGRIDEDEYLFMKVVGNKIV
jgi:hypothetical protein